MSDSQLLTDQEPKPESGSEKSVDVSVVIPVSERNDDLRQIYLQHRKVLADTGHSCEFVFVLDGPKPELLESLRKLKEEYPDVTVMMLNRWFGEATALSVGFERARGDVILTLPAYRQIEAGEIPRM